LFALPDKWTAFWLSLVLPGAGQLAARNWSFLPWLTGTCFLGAAVAWLPGTETEIGRLLPISLAALLGLVSAEHAKRLLEAKRNRSSDATWSLRCLRRSVHSENTGNRSLNVLMSLDFACSADELWTVVSDLPRFLTIDPFHDRVTLQQLPAAKGVDVVLSHNAFGLRFLRFGKILHWHEGLSFTLSDLSGRNKRSGFPHVFVVRIEQAHPAAAEPTTTLTIRVLGRWSSRLIPVAVGRLWVSWVCHEHARLLAKAL
jgi:hypothetical protein